jgi:hypothetical protein
VGGDGRLCARAATGFPRARSGVVLSPPPSPTAFRSAVLCALFWPSFRVGELPPLCAE